MQPKVVDRAPQYRPTPNAGGDVTPNDSRAPTGQPTAAQEARRKSMMEIIHRLQAAALDTPEEQDDEAVLSSLRALNHLSLGDGMAKFLVLNGLYVVLDVVEQRVRDLPVVTVFLELMSRLSYHEDVCKHLAKRDVLSNIVLLGKMHAAKWPIPLVVMRIFGNLSRLSDLRAQLTETGAVAVVLDLLEANRDKSELQIDGCRTLINLSFLEGNQRAIGKAGGIGQLKAVLQAHHKEPQVAFEAARALYNLTYQNQQNKDLLVQHEVLPLLCKIMKEHQSNDDILLYGFQVLSNIALVSEDYRKLIREEGLIALVQASKRKQNAKLFNKVSEFERVLQGDWDGSQADIRTDQSVYMFKRPLPMKYVIKALDRRIQANSLLGDLVIYVPFLIMFIFFFLVGQPGQQEFLTLNALRAELQYRPWGGQLIHKAFNDIGNADDFWTWFDTVAIPVLWQRYTPGAQVQTFKGNQMLLGAVRLRTLQVPHDSCSVNTQLYPDSRLLSRDCYGKYSYSRQRREPLPPSNITWRSCSVVGGTFTSATTSDVTGYNCGGYVVDLPFNLTLGDALGKAAQLQATGFLDGLATRFVTVELFSYATQFDIFTSTKMYVQVTPSGDWVPSAQYRNFRMWTRHDVGKTVYDCFFFLYVLAYMWWFFRDFLRDRKVYRKRPFRYFFKGWNILELINLVCFAVVFSFKFKWLRSSQRSDFQLPGGSAYPRELESVLQHYSVVRYFNSVNTILTFLKLLKYLEMNSNFNVLTRTLEKCASGVFSLLVVFTVIIFGFAITGTSLFGTGMRDFRDLNSSFASLLMMLLGRFDYPSMRLELKWAAGIYFWGFQVLGLFLYMNFLVAIISDAFSDVVNSNTKRPLPDQLVDAARDVRWNLGAPALFKRFEMLRHNKSVTKVLRTALEKVLIPYQRRIDAQHRWAKLREQFRHERRAKQLGSDGAAVEEKRKEKAMTSLVYLVGWDSSDTIEVTYNLLKDLLPEGIKTDLGEFYLQRVWEELVWQYDLELSQPAQQEGALFVDMVQYCTKTAARDIFGVARELKQKLQAVELKAKEVILHMASDIRGPSRGPSMAVRGKPALKPLG
eukprot:TRINITY_DN13597_c0_g1_i2.p1 TRINITY_DN13597_c0_g1~~TRINITY_DN13597_c0_g1_i2.p1  ORF type:complete len:1083 (+),score=292.91 TRINITY_DN13597_c0_g1_i2:83-3331(+)